MSASGQDEYDFYQESLPEWGIEEIWLAQDRAGDIFYPARPLIEALGVQRTTQTAIMQEDSRLRRGLRIIDRAPTRGGRQTTIYLRKHEVSIWLAIIDPARLGERARGKGKLEQFQRDLFHLAQRLAFRQRRLAEGVAEDIGLEVEIQGEQVTEYYCLCGRRHVHINRDGKTRVYIDPE
jgi:hypothetical protein